MNARKLNFLVLSCLLFRSTFLQAQPTEEVPFITSPDNVTLKMLSVAGVKRGDHVIDLGSGDGRIVILAAKRFEATGLGVVIDPSLVARSKTNAREKLGQASIDFLFYKLWLFYYPFYKILPKNRNR